MKDYYKILGLEPTATAQEIHDRWIELMQRYHPDTGSGGKPNEDLAKEINEAYEVLKHSCSRIQYDLERLRLKKGKRGFVWRTVSALSATVTLLLFAVFLFRGPSDPVKVDERAQGLSGKVILPFESLMPEREITEEVSTAQKDMVVKREENVPSEFSPQQRRMLLAGLVEPAKTATRARPSSDLTKPVTSSASLEASGLRPIPSGHGKTVEPRFQKSALVAPVSVSSTPVKPIREEDPAPVSQASQLIATEDEVKDFLGRYIDCYIKKEVEPFLSLFSPKAIQNGRDGWQAIRRIYENFFYQSEWLQYRLEDLKAEIGGEAVKARARFEVHQILRKDGERKVWRGTIRWVLGKEEGLLKIVSLDYEHDRTLQGQKEHANGD